jgi:uncharacterized membrane protein
MRMDSSVPTMDRLTAVWLDGAMSNGTVIDGSIIDGFPRTLTIVASVATALVGGVLFGFSSFVMPALRRLPPRDGLVAMQSINKAAPASPAFMLALMGTAVLCVGLGVMALAGRDKPAAPYLLAGCALYLVAIAITAVYHVPHNDALNLVDAGAPDAGSAWRAFETGWTAWNHVRTVAALGSAVAFVLALGAA